jgi:inhibitor of KinA sporulation pathway (predicted exonuclease)
MSWGDYDRSQITRECERKNYNGQMVKLVQNHINIKWRVSQSENIQHLGLGRALKRFKMKFEGTHHRGIDDARNIARIAKMFKQILIMS